MSEGGNKSNSDLVRAIEADLDVASVLVQHAISRVLRAHDALPPTFMWRADVLRLSLQLREMVDRIERVKRGE